MSFLELKDIDIYYDDLPALKNVSLKVEMGEIVSIIGANGSGKTTTLNTISSLLHPRKGEIWFDNREIHYLPSHRVVNMGIIQVPEGRRLFPLMTTLENLKVGAYSRRREKNECRQTLENVLTLLPILKQRANQISSTMSGGEQQILAIGRALMGKPRLLMLDEPSLGIAPIMLAEIFEITKKINHQGTTILLVEQNVKHCLELSNRGYVLENGRVALEGAGIELLGNDKVKTAYLGI